jgi:predicted RNase H-like HicB family nuclease
MERTYNAVYLKVPEGYVGFIEELPGVSTQGADLDEARRNLRDAAETVLEANRALTLIGTDGEEVIREPLSIYNKLMKGGDAQ